MRRNTSLRRMVSVIKSYCHNHSLFIKVLCPYSTLLPGAEHRKDRRMKNKNPIQTVCRFCRHHRNLTSTTACWLISRSIIIGHFPLRTCPPRTGCTPAFPLGSLDAIFLHILKMCRSVSAPRLRLLKWLMYLDCWIWLARTIFMYALSEAMLPAFCQGS